MLEAPVPAPEWGWDCERAIKTVRLQLTHIEVQRPLGQDDWAKNGANEALEWV